MNRTSIRSRETDTPLGQARQLRGEGLGGERHPDPGQPRLPELGQEPLPSFFFSAEGGPGPVFPELAEELRSGQRSLVAGHLGAEGLHEGGGPGGRDAEEPFDVAAGEQGPVELFELADGVGDGEEPPGLGGHPRSDPGQPVALVWVGTIKSAHVFRHVSRRFYRMQDPGPARPGVP